MKLVKFFENFSKILRKFCFSWLTKICKFFCKIGVVRVLELVKFLEKSWCGE